MSAERDIDLVLGDKPYHPTTRYRRRDLRNGLASRMGYGEGSHFEKQPHYQRPRNFRERGIDRQPHRIKKRVRFTNLPATLSEEDILNLVKEISSPVYSRMYDREDGRTAIFEFEDPNDLDRCVSKFNGSEIQDRIIAVEKYEYPVGRPYHSASSKGPKLADRIGKNYYSGTPRRGAKQKAPRREPHVPTSAADLDAELDAYMKGE